MTKVIQLHIYRAQDDEIEVHMVDMDMWLSQRSMAQLFGAEVNTINEHVKNVFHQDQLDSSTIRKIRIVQVEGKREVSRLVEHYNLDVIVSVGYRVNSAEASRFRKWANSIIRDYLTQGIAINEKRLENLDSDTLDRVSSHSVKAIVSAYRARGESDEKIRARLNGIVSRQDVTAAWKHWIQGDFNYGRLTNETYIGLFRRDAKQLTRANGGLPPRDGMTTQGLDLLSAAESTIAQMLENRGYVYVFEALSIFDMVCRQIAPTIEGLQNLLGVDLGTSQPLLPDGGEIA